MQGITNFPCERSEPKTKKQESKGLRWRGKNCERGGVGVLSTVEPVVAVKKAHLKFLPKGKNFYIKRFDIVPRNKNISFVPFDFTVILSPIGEIKYDRITKKANAHPRHIRS